MRSIKTSNQHVSSVFPNVWTHSTERIIGPGMDICIYFNVFRKTTAQQTLKITDKNKIDLKRKTEPEH